MSTHPKYGKPSLERFTVTVAETFATQRADRQFTDKKFVGWDGEGYTDSNGDHHYYLFGSSLGMYVQGASLTAEQCFDLLLASPKQNHINVIFAGGYDMVMMIHDWPTPTVERILKGSQPGITTTGSNTLRVSI